LPRGARLKAQSARSPASGCDGIRQRFDRVLTHGVCVLDHCATRRVRVAGPMQSLLDAITANDQETVHARRHAHYTPTPPSIRNQQGSGGHQQATSPCGGAEMGIQQGGLRPIPATPCAVARRCSSYATATAISRTDHRRNRAIRHFWRTDRPDGKARHKTRPRYFAGQNAQRVAAQHPAQLASHHATIATWHTAGPRDLGIGKATGIARGIAPCQTPLCTAGHRPSAPARASTAPIDIRPILSAACGIAARRRDFRAAPSRPGSLPGTPARHG